MVFKKIELVGTSENGFFEAVDEAVKEAAKTISGISWIEVKDLKAHVKDGEISNYKATVVLAFKVMHEK
jgi:flavin-binding protein dodecin